MWVYSISKKAYCKDLSGMGAGMHGGRWNPKGINLLYTSGSIALASLEFMVHNYHLLSSGNISMAKIEIDENAPILEYPISKLPKGWNLQLHSQIATQKIGSLFFNTGEHYILKVPSAVVPGEYNLLLNPLHKSHSKTKVIELIDPFTFDSRLFDFVK